MRTMRVSLVGMVILALLGGLSVTVLAQEQAEWAAVSGTSSCGLETAGIETDGPPYSLTDQVLRCTGVSTDPRVSGPSTVVINVEGWDLREGNSAVAWFDNIIEGPEGTWVGHSYGLYGDEGVLHLVGFLVGNGAYEGLTFSLAGTVPAGTSVLAYDGLIQPGSPPPGFPVAPFPHPTEQPTPSEEPTEATATATIGEPADVHVAYGGEEDSASAADTSADVPSVYFREGTVPGVRVWQLPDAPGGYQPDQSWLAVGSGPDGGIYISGHDHTLNSMLYRLDPGTGYLTWVGDARTASIAADNWEPGETAEKFHTRPTHHDGRMYVATLDKSSIDDAFLSTRGFHWYAYDLASGDFVDLSADEPGGVGAQHLQVVTIQADTVNDRVYGMTIPENRLLYYDVAQGRTTVVGTPDEWQGYFYSNRFMWTDSRGNLYMTGGTERAQWDQDEDRAVLDSVWRYTPDSGFEDTGFALQTLAAIEVGQWNSGHDTLYVSDDMGHIYRFTDATATWEYLGRPDFPAGETPSGFNKVWVFQLDPGEETIYLGRSDNFGRPNEIWEFDVDTGRSSILAVLPDLDTPAGSEAFITGYDSWDSQGSFYIAAFSMYDSENAYLIGLDPEQIRSSDPDSSTQLPPTAASASPEMMALAAKVEDALDYVAGDEYSDPRDLFAPDAVFVDLTGWEVQANEQVPADFGLDDSWDWDGDGTVTFGDYIYALDEWFSIIATERTAACEPDGSEIVCRGDEQDVFGDTAGLDPRRSRARFTFADGAVVRRALEAEEETDWEPWLEQLADYERWIADLHPDVHPTVFRSPCCAGNPDGMWFTAESFEAQRSLAPEWAESIGVTYAPPPS